MKTISQPRFEPAPAQDSNRALRSVDLAARLFRFVRELAEETGDTVAGVFGMPLRPPFQDRQLDRLNDHLLRDIGRE